VRQWLWHLVPKLAPLQLLDYKVPDSGNWLNRCAAKSNRSSRYLILATRRRTSVNTSVRFVMVQLQSAGYHPRWNVIQAVRHTTTCYTTANNHRQSFGSNKTALRMDVLDYITGSTGSGVTNNYWNQFHRLYHDAVSTVKRISMIVTHPSSYNLHCIYEILAPQGMVSDDRKVETTSKGHSKSSTMTHVDRPRVTSY